MFKNKYAKSGSKGGRPKTPSVDDDEEEAERQRVRVAVANTRNQESFHIVFHSCNTFLCKIQTIRHPLQDQDLTAIQVPKLLAVLAVHLQLQGLAAHPYPPLVHRRHAGGHELPAVCQTNGGR